jgi:phenylalanyl-tRNA synthetase beta chain
MGGEDSGVSESTTDVMLDLGRPAHAYDVAKLDGALSARAAKDGEKVLALNEREYTLAPSRTVIADEREVHDIGGIMGGEDTGVSDGTTDVVLEVAYFTPERIAQTGQKLALTSDARTRFERGVDPAFLKDGLDVLTGLIIQLCGGEPSEALLIGEAPVERKTAHFDPARMRALGGVEVAEDRQREILASLGFELDGDKALVPTWRRDVDGTADLVEEVARIVGYDRLITEALPRPSGVAKPTATRPQMIERQVRRTAAARGLEEAVTWSFISDAEAAPFGGGDWRLSNPISEQMKVMRPSLLPGLIAAAQRNISRGASSVRLFELGRRYLADNEHLTATLLLTGNRQDRSWQSGKAQAFDAFDAKAEVLALLEAAGAPVANLQLFPDAGPTWHPGRSATLRLGPKTIVAAFGELHPRLLKELDAPERSVAGEVYLDALPAARSSGRSRAAYAPPLLQPVTRDFAFIVPANVTADALVRAIRGADKQAIVAARLFDRFEAPEGLSLAVEVMLQPGEKSFTEPELAEIGSRIVAAAEKLGARLRS